MKLEHSARNLSEHDREVERRAVFLRIHSSIYTELSFTSTHGTIPIATMWILPLVGYAGVLLGFGFLTLAIGTPPSLIPKSLS